MKENSGSQDPIWASYGGFNKIIFKKGKFDIKKINISDNNLIKISKNFFLIYTGINKFSNEIEKDKISKISKNFSNLDEIYKLTLEFSKNLVEAKNYDFVGPTLNEYWLIKKRLSNKVSNKKIDEIYKECLLAGASGGKIIGSGGGGFLLIYCKKKNHINLKRRINKLPIVNFNFINEGSKIVFKS